VTRERIKEEPTPSHSRGVRQATQPRRGLSREEAAVYIGVSVRKFDELSETAADPIGDYPVVAAIVSARAVGG
jgi:hypothetical protein